MTRFIKITALIFILSLSAINTQASYPYGINTKTSYKLNYKNQRLNLKGYFFGKEVLITPRKDLYQLNSKNIVDSFRNIFTAYHLREKQWLSENTLGNKKYFRSNLAKNYAIFKKNLPHMKGYALYDDYVILFLHQKQMKRKLIFVLKEDDLGDYKISLDFHKNHKKTYNIIRNAYMGRGDFVIVKKR